MTNDQLYHSTQSVPARVDAAWAQGYEAGQRQARRLAGLALIVALFVELRRHRVHVLPTFLIALAVALVTVPVMVTVLVIRTGWRVHRRRRPGSATPTAAAVQLSDGSWF